MPASRLSRPLLQLFSLGFLLALALGIHQLSAWTAPTQTAPNCVGCTVPLHTGSGVQTKTGGLQASTLEQLGTNGASLIGGQLSFWTGGTITNPSYTIDMDPLPTGANNGIRFPDGTVQTTAASSGGSSGGGSAVQTTTSGTQANFTGIPSGVNEITVIFSDVSFSGSDSLLVQIGGTSAGIETTGYASDGSRVQAATAAESSTAGFIVSMNSGTRFFSGTMTLTRFNGNTWIASHAGTLRTTTTAHGGGTKTLTGSLDRIRITGTLGGAFDSGVVGIRY